MRLENVHKKDPNALRTHMFFLNPLIPSPIQIISILHQTGSIMKFTFTAVVAALLLVPGITASALPEEGPLGTSYYRFTELALT